MTADNVAEQLGLVINPGTLTADVASQNRLRTTQTWMRANKVSKAEEYSNYLSDSAPYSRVLADLQLLSGGKVAAARDGIAVVHFDYMHNVVRDLVAAGKAVRVTNGAAVAIPDGTLTRCAFVLFRSFADTFAHEIGHHLFMPHAKYPLPPGNQPGGFQVDRHDDDDNECLMSYARPRPAFCGLCQLRLRGWDATALNKDDNLNKRP